MSFLSHLLSGMTGMTDTYPDGSVLVDVRSAAECAGGIIEGSHLIANGQLHELEAKIPDKTTPIVVYCASGMRSMSTRSQLLKMGYKEVYNGGGISDVAKHFGVGLVKPS